MTDKTFTLKQLTKLESNSSIEIDSFDQFVFDRSDDEDSPEDYTPMTLLSVYRSLIVLKNKNIELIVDKHKWITFDSVKTRQTSTSMIEYWRSLIKDKKRLMK